MRVSIEDNSIPNSALLDGYNGTGGVVSSSTTSTDSSIITLVAGYYFVPNQLVSLFDGMAVLADDVAQPCIGIALDTVVNWQDPVRVKISGIHDVANNTANEYYLGELGAMRPFAYIPNRLLQKVADKINDNQIFINIEKSVLML